MKAEKKVADPDRNVNARPFLSVILVLVTIVVLLTAAAVLSFVPGFPLLLSFMLAAVAFALGALAGFALDRRSVWRRLQASLDFASSPMCVVDAKGVILHVNIAFQHWLGLSPGEFKGKSAFSLLQTPDDPGTGSVIAEEIRRTRLEGAAWAGTVKVKITGMAEEAVLLTISPFSHRRALSADLWTFSGRTSREHDLSGPGLFPGEFRHLIEDAPEGILVVQAGTVVFTNAAAAAMFGHASVSTFERVKFSDVIAPPSRPFLFGTLDGRRVGDELLKNDELKGLTRRGDVIDLEANARVTLWGGKPAVQVTLRNVTERKQWERDQAQWFWEQEMLAAIDRQLVSVVDLGAVFDMISHHARLLTRADWAGVMVYQPGGRTGEWKGIRADTAAGKGTRVSLDLLPPVLRSEEETVQLTNAQEELGDRCADVFPFDAGRVVSTAWFPLKIDGTARGRLVLVFHRSHDVTDRERRLLTHLAEKSSLALANAELYEKHRIHEEELRLLTGARVNAQEEERRRIARELHDGLGQILTAIKFNMEVLEDAENLTEKDRTKLFEVRKLLEGAMQTAREISRNLMPSVLEDFGLAPALQVLCEQTAKSSELQVLFHAHGDVGRFLPTIETGLFRIAQEALNNVVKHARANTTEVQLLVDEKSVRLTIEDDGSGFDQYEIRKRIGPEGLGLVSMRERAVSLGGTFSIESRPGGGTEIFVELPRPTE